MRASAWTVATLAWIVLAGAGPPFHAQTISPAEEPAAEAKAGKELHALRIGSSTTIRLDGRIDDEPWRRAQIISDLQQDEPDNMAAPTEATTVRVAYDDRYIYIAMEMLMRDPSQVRDGLARRGRAPPSDRIYVGVDTAHDPPNTHPTQATPTGR